MNVRSNDIRRFYTVVGFATWIEDVMRQIDELRRRGLLGISK